MKIAFFYGFDRKINYGADGISRYVKEMISSILKYTEHKVQIWTITPTIYDIVDQFNTEEIKKIEFFTDNYLSDTDWSTRVKDIERQYNLYSDADIVLIPYIGQPGGPKLKSPIVVWLHDLMSFQLYNEDPEKYKNFIEVNEVLKPYIFSYALNEDAYFLSNCNYVKKNHHGTIVKSITGQDILDRSYVVPLPPIPGKKFGDICPIDKPFVFFPSKLRSYKNEIVILKALEYLRNEKDVKIYAYFTDTPRYIIREGSKSYILNDAPVNDNQLDYLYQNAVAVVCPSYFEGGFPTQAHEAFQYNTPVVMATRDYVDERIEELGFTGQNSNILFFDPQDFKTLAIHILACYQYREIIQGLQYNFAKVYSSYTWKIGIERYLNAFESMIKDFKSKN